MIVCHCAAINDRRLRELTAVADTVAEITSSCGAAGDCGACVDRIEDLLDEYRRLAPVAGS